MYCMQRNYGLRDASFYLDAKRKGCGETRLYMSARLPNEGRQSDVSETIASHSHIAVLKPLVPSGGVLQ